MLKLVAQDLCPYAQRCRILLEARAIPHATDYIQLDNKPAWFLARAPAGRVPVLLDGARVIEDSLRINEYLERRFDSPVPAPADPAGYQRCEDALASLWAVFQATTVAQRRTSMTALELQLQALAAYAPTGCDDAPLDLIDCAAAPLLLRVRWALEVPGFGHLQVPPGIDAWTDRLQAHPSVKRSVLPSVPDRYRERLARRLASAGDHVQHAAP